jgi:hypothetical protein
MKQNTLNNNLIKAINNHQSRAKAIKRFFVIITKKNLVAASPFEYYQSTLSKSLALKAELRLKVDYKISHHKN